jgi:hypothetical protein
MAPTAITSGASAGATTLARVTRCAGSISVLKVWIAIGTEARDQPTASVMFSSGRRRRRGTRRLLAVALMTARARRSTVRDPRDRGRKSVARVCQSSQVSATSAR